MSAGLRCPLCGSWYTDDAEQHVSWRAGDVCGNRARTGPKPNKCSPEHPCHGALVPDSPELAAQFSAYEEDCLEETE
jgi:hypothetical protein